MEYIIRYRLLKDCRCINEILNKTFDVHFDVQFKHLMKPFVAINSC